MKIINNLPQLLYIQKQLTEHKTSEDHDERYYTETEIDNMLSGKSDTNHNHDLRYLQKSAVVNNNTITEAGYALDARQANPNISGSLGAQIDTLNETFTQQIGKLNTDLANYLPLSGGTMKNTILGSAGGEFTTEGNVYINCHGYANYLTNILDGLLAKDGQHSCINPTSDLNSFYNGIGLFSSGTLNLPESDWFLVVAGGTVGTVTQMAFNLWTGFKWSRYCAASSWSAWNGHHVMSTEPYNGIYRLGNMGYDNGGLYIYIDSTKHYIPIN